MVYRILHKGQINQNILFSTLKVHISIGTIVEKCTKKHLFITTLNNHHNYKDKQIFRENIAIIAYVIKGL